MGLEGVELVMDVEDIFNIKIPDGDAEKIETVGQLHKYILNRIGSNPHTVKSLCISSVVFYKLRSAIIQLQNVKRKKIRTKTHTNALLPIYRRRRQWKQLENYLQLNIPSLIVPSSISRSIFASFVLLFVTFAFFIKKIVMGTSEIYPIILLFSFFAWIYLVFITFSHLPKFLFFAIPNNCKKVGDFSKTIIYTNLDKLPLDLDVKNIVWNKLCDMIVDGFGVSREELHPETHFVRDLKFG